MDDLKERLLSLPQTEEENRWLRERLADLSAKESYQLAAVMLRDAPENGVGAVNCLLKMPDCEVCLNAGSYAALGEYCLRYKEDVHKDVLPFVDLEQLGRLYEDANPGVFVGNCYVAYPTKEPPQYHPGEHLPAADQDWSVKLKLASADCPEGVWLRLPDYENTNGGKADEIEIAFHELGVEFNSECTLLDAKCVLPWIGNLKQEYSSLADLIYDGNDLGFILDEQGQGMPDFNVRFAAAMEFEDCHSLKLALDISQNLHCYDYVPASGVEDFAREELQKLGFCPRDAPMAEQCIDYHDYGEDLLDRQGYVLTDTGDAYIRRNSQKFHYDRAQRPTQEQGMTMQ